MAHKAAVKNVVAVFDLKGTFSLLDPEKNRKARFRGPMEQGQGKVHRHVRLYGITNEEMWNRVAAATKILENGTGEPEAVKGSIKKKPEPRMATMDEKAAAKKSAAKKPAEKK